MPFGPLVEFVAFGSTDVVGVPEPVPMVPLVPVVLPAWVVVELEPFDCAMAEVAKAMVSRDAERIFVIM
ncbi:hypothetical protein X743_08785 [Mesorhizobium sp. LNHC252B00]|nr:hypothetical protein X743_08785 [Mesorhizobium sp. LNHC252B00]